MPIVTMPDGQQVDMPDNPPPELLARLKAIISKQHNFDAKAEDLPPGQVPQPNPDDAPSAAAGIPGAIMTALSAVPATLAGNVAGAASRIGGASMEDAAKRAQEVAAGLTYKPSDPAKAALEKAAEVVSATKLEGLNPAVAVSAAAVPATSIQRAAKSAVRAIAESPEADMAKKAGAAVVKAPGAAADAVVIPEVRALAQKAMDWGIDIRPDMLTDNKFMRMMGEALEKVPASGSKADQRQIAFNRVLMQQIGLDTRAEPLKRLTPEVYDRALTKSGRTIGQISERTPINLAADEAGGLDQALSAFVENSQKFDTSDAARIAGNYVNELRSKAEEGVIPGTTFRKISSEIKAKARSTKDGDLRNTLIELNDVLEDALQRHVAVLHPEDVGRLEAARKQYAIGIQIAPLVAKAPKGNISPAGLMGVVTDTGFKKQMMARGRGGEMGDLARIGQAFLKEPDSSGTTERGLVYKVLGLSAGGGAAGTAAMAEPATAAATAASIYGAANLYNRAGPAITRALLRDKGKKAITLQDISESVTE